MSAVPTNRSRTKSGVLLALALITLLAFALRFSAVHRLLPQVPEPDAFLVLHAQQLDGDPALVRHWEFAERYPTLLTRILQSLPRRELEKGLAGVEQEQDALACAAAPYVHGRILALLFSIALVPLTWLVARRFVGTTASLIAAWFVATSLLHALFSTQARPHGPQTTMALLAVWGALRIAERPSVQRIAVGAGLSSLAIACLQSGLFTLFPLAIALLSSGGALWLRLTKAALVPIAAAAAAFWAYPVLPHVDSAGVHLGGAGGHAFFFNVFNFHGLSVTASWFFGHDPVLFVTTLLGLACGIAWLWRHGRDFVHGGRPALAVVIAYVVPYFALIAVSEEIYERFLLPLLPWCAILSAWAWAPFLTWGEGSRLPRVLTSAVRALSAVVLLLPLAPLVQFARASAHPDTLEEAAAWLRAHAQPGERIVGSPYLSLPVLFDPEVVEAMRGDTGSESNPWISWQMAHRLPTDGLDLMLMPVDVARPRAPDGAFDAWIAAQNPRWIALESSRRMESVGAVRRCADWADAHGELVFSSTGVAPEVLERGLADYQAIDDAARRLLGTDAFGPRVRIWKITR